MKIVIYNSILNSMLKKFSIYLIGLLPLSLVAGPFVAEVFLFILFLIALYFFLRPKKKIINFFNNKLINLFILFWLYIVCVSLFAIEPLISIKSSFFYLRFGIYTLAIVYLLSLNKDCIDILYTITKYTILFVVLDSLLQIISGKDIFGLEPNSIDLMRVSGPFGDKFILGSFLQKILPIFIFFILKKYHLSKRIKILDIAIIIFSFAIIYRSGDRSALGLIILFSAIFFIINSELRKKMLTILIFFLVISTIFTLHNPKIFQRNFIDTMGQFKGKYYESFLKKEFNETNFNFMIFSFHHQTHYTTAMRMFYDKPIYGHGVKMFRYKCKDFEFKPSAEIKNSFGQSKFRYGCSTHPHNTYVQLLAETGLIGFLFVFGAFLYISFEIVKYINKAKKKYYPESALLIAIFVNLWPIIPTGNFFNNWLSIIYLIPITYYLFEKKYVTKDTIA